MALALGAVIAAACPAAVYAEKHGKKNSPAAKATHAPAAAVKKEGSNTKSFEIPGMTADFNDLPTFIKADTLTLKSDQRVFSYSGHVEVRHGDMTMTADQLEGNYDQNNQLQQLSATSNVVITRGDTMRGTSEKAIYDAPTQIATLTESPEVQQNNSVLTADVIKMFMKENRSSAEGQVRVKLVKPPDEDKKLP